MIYLKSDIISSLKENADYIKNKISIHPKIAIVLGSGLGSLADSFDDSIKISYSELKDFPNPTVSGHSGKFVFTEIFN